MLTIIYKIIAGGIGALGYSLLYNIRKKHMLLSFLTSALISGISLLVDNFSIDILQKNIICAAIATCIAEILARIRHAPAIIFLMPPLITLVPGGYLYYTMYGIVTKNYQLVSDNAASTVLTALGLAAGIVIVSVIMSLITKKSASVR